MHKILVNVKQLLFSKWPILTTNNRNILGRQFVISGQVFLHMQHFTLHSLVIEVNNSSGLVFAAVEVVLVDSS